MDSDRTFRGGHPGRLAGRRSAEMEFPENRSAEPFDQPDDPVLDSRTVSRGDFQDQA